MTQKGRMANYELLRVLAMVMVVVMHFLACSDSLPALDMPLNGVRLAGGLLEAFCLVAVNVYVLITGYFGAKGSFKVGKAAGLLCRIWFYALLIPLVLTMLGIPTQGGTIGVYGWIQYLFPIETEHYWFATSYFMLYLLTPVLGAAVKSMPKRQLQVTLACLLVLFSGIKSISPVVFVFDKYGYDMAWFICVYLLAAYLSLYGWELFEKRGWLIYVLCAFASFGVSIAMWFLARRWDSFRYYFTVPYHYNYILCLAGAVGLFYGFSHIHIKEGALAGVIRKLGSLCFGVYLFHEHIDLRDRWYGWIRGIVNSEGREGMLFFAWELLCSIVILFAAGLVIDWIRSILFAKSARILHHMRDKARK
ncbi:MAG: acyltransferase [Clostridium sp.]|nr:acyltransferase [Clostridium sp.]